MKAWYYTDVNGGRQGPRSEDELRRRIANGEVQETALVWADGMQDWAPATAFFVFPETTGDRLSPVSDVPIIPPAPEPPPVAAPVSAEVLHEKTSGSWRLHAIAVFVGIGGLALFSVISWSTPWDAPYLEIGVLAACLVAGLTALVVCSRRLFARGPSAGRAMVAVYSTLAVVGLCLHGPALVEGFKVARERSKATYAIDFQPLQQKAVISGLLGPGVAARIREAVDAHNLNTIVLDSDGGMIVDAMKLADLVSEFNLTTVAAKRCHSACVMPFMAGRKRYAEVGTVLGFHDPAYAGAISPFFAKISGDPGKDYFSRLAADGLPEKYIDLARSTPSKDLAPRTAIDLIADGVPITILDEAGNQMTLAQAQWAWMQQALDAVKRTSNTPLNDAAVELFGAVARSRPDIVDKYGGSIYAAAQLTGKDNSVADVTQQMVAGVRMDAALSADDHALTLYLRGNNALVSKLIDEKDYVSCAMVSYGPSAATAGAKLPEAVSAELMRMLLRLMQSADETHWMRAPILPSSDARVTLLARQSGQEMAQAGLHPAALDTDVRSQCGFGYLLMQKVANASEAVAASDYRHLLQLN